MQGPAMLKALGKAMLMGTLAAAFPPMLMTVPAALMSLAGPGIGLAQVGYAIQLAIMPLVLAATLVIPTTLVIGLPLWAFLRRLRWDSPPLLAIAGAVVGFFVLWIAVYAIGGRTSIVVALLAAFSGGVTGYFWGTGAREIADLALASEETKP